MKHIAELIEMKNEYIAIMTDLQKLIKELNMNYSVMEDRITQLEKEMNSVIISLDRLEELHI